MVNNQLDKLFFIQAKNKAILYDVKLLQYKDQYKEKQKKIQRNKS